MKTTSIMARLREENAELRADKIALLADNLAMLDAIVKYRLAIVALRAELQAIKNPGEHAEADEIEIAEDDYATSEASAPSR